MRPERTQPRWRRRLREITPAFERIELPDPKTAAATLAQDEEYADVVIRGQRCRVRLHDYDQVYPVPGLYEAIIYDRLQCCSPSRCAALLAEVLDDQDETAEALRVLDVGAGNGMMGDELDALGVAALVGVDIIPEARAATLRDRPRVYDDYLVTDLADLPESDEEQLRRARLNCLTVVGALGYGDIPARAFVKAMDLIASQGWLVFNIHEGFLYAENVSGFSRVLRQLCQERIIQYQAYQRYRHRVSVRGEPIHYVAVVARKLTDLSDELMERWAGDVSA